jgi:benzoyl-CoA 2,3-dioxygenase component A
MGQSDIAVIRQHLIDPEICIRCNTCESVCPVGAITHDSRNYVVDADKCNLCMACVPPCPTGSIDNWRMMPKALAWSTEAQLGRCRRRYGSGTRIRHDRDGGRPRPRGPL